MIQTGIFHDSSTRSFAQFYRRFYPNFFDTMNGFRLFYLLPFFLLGVLCIMGCPHHIESMAEKVMPPKNYKPMYMTSSVKFGYIMEKYAERQNGMTISADTNKSADNISSLFSFVIRSVDDKRYPHEIEVRASVSDSAGRFVLGLAPPYFSGKGDYRRYWQTLVDSCTERHSALDSFAVTEVRENASEPYALAFVLDHSPSMGDFRARKLQTAVAQTLGIIKESDYASVIKFSKNVMTEIPLSNHQSDFKNKLKIDGLQGKYGNGTAIYDGISAGMEQVSKAPAGYRKAIIMFTDGEDNSSRVKVDSVYKAAKHEGIVVFTIAYGITDEAVLQRIATKTGGRMYRIYSTEEFQYVFADIYRSLKNYYKITYRPPACGGMHGITLELKFPELGGGRLVERGSYERPVEIRTDTVGSITFVNIQFDYNKAGIREESLPLLQEIYETLQKNPTMTMEIRGHTDDEGGLEYNQTLSEKRAHAVAEALEKMGIAANRLTTKGFGKTRPLVPNDTPENHRRNRRTEFVITGK